MIQRIPVSIHIECGKRDEDMLDFHLHVGILGGINSDFACTIRTNYYEEPTPTEYLCDDFGLPHDLRDRFAVAVYGMLRPHLLNDEPSYPDAVIVDDPDFRPWLETTFYHADATKLARLLAAHVSADVEVLLKRRVVTARIG